MGFPPWSRGPLLHRGEKRQLSPFGRTRGFKPRVRYNLISLYILRALRGDISLLLTQIRDYGWLHWPAKPSAPVTCDRFLPMKCSTERFNKDFLAKTPRPQRKIFSYFSELGVLCPVEYRLTKIELFARSAIPRGE